MFGALAKGVLSAVTEVTEAALEGTDAMVNIVGAVATGGEPKGENVRALIHAGFSIAEIASFFGVAERVIRELENE